MGKLWFFGSIFCQGKGKALACFWQRSEQWLVAEGRRVMVARGEEDGGAFDGFGKEL